MTKITAVLVGLFLMVVSTAFGQVLSDKTAQRLNVGRVADAWSQVQVVRHELATAPRISVNIIQAQATIEVTTSGQGVLAVFSSLVPLPNGFVSFRMTLPGGTVVPMEGYQISSEGGLVGATLWNGSFPGPWVSGPTLLEAFVESSTTGPSYTSAYVSVNSCCSLTGPLERADVSADGNTITINGLYLRSDTLATVNGQQLPVEMSFSPTTGAYQGKIDVRDIYEGQKTLTVCSGGNCSSRVLYIPRRGTTTTPSN
jgi:hypothetical protein